MTTFLSVKENLLIGSQVAVGSFRTWEIGKKLAAKYRQQADLHTGGSTIEQQEVYEATRIDKRSSGPDIIKIKKQVVPWSDGSVEGKLSEEVSRETDNLTPMMKSQEDILYTLYIVMEKVPSENLANFDDLSAEEQKEAMWEFFRHCYTHWDPRREKLLWDPRNKLCFIVDLEDAEFRENRKLNNVRLSPAEELEYWRLIKGDFKYDYFSDEHEMMEYAKNELYLR
ncbi:hypothetical protein BJY00DRAFT_307116 [Aspergillus carlsbadensis]|nr:hypothetical protein BJY00DRAFT_307116 [Aspergillus carlsbadensis]